MTDSLGATTSTAHTQAEHDGKPIPISSAYHSQLANELVRMKTAYNRERMPSNKTRRQWLRSLKAMLKENEQAIVDAIDTDFKGRSADETRIAEIMPSIQGINHSIHKVSGWMRPSYRWPGLTMVPAISKVHYQPLGVVGILVPWNYPLLLAVGPLNAALSAGNRAMIKMPEHTPVFSALFEKLIQQYLGDDVVKVFNGGADLAVEFTKQPFDHMIFTGSTNIGRHVMHAAADNLTPVTLELGGKSPAIVSEGVNLDMAAERICFGKSLNSGQTCIAPDYVLVPNSRLDDFIRAYKSKFNRMYPEKSRLQDFSNMINTAQADRIRNWLNSAEQSGATIHHLIDNATDTKNEQSINPVIVTNCDNDQALIQQEIFGPVLPVIGYESLEDAVAYVNDRPRPLALYFFSHESKEQKYVLNETHSGGVCLNDTIMHIASEGLPFGGIGPSGMGHYHSKEGFLALSKAKAVLGKGRISTTKLIYPPYRKSLITLIYKIFAR